MASCSPDPACQSACERPFALAEKEARQRATLLQAAPSPWPEKSKAQLERWLQPGGHVDPEDTDICAAALREVREEVGLDDATFEGGGIFDVDVHAIPARKQDPEHFHFDVRFALRARSLEFTAASDAVAGKWMKLGDIDAEVSDRSVMRAVEKLSRR